MATRRELVLAVGGLAVSACVSSAAAADDPWEQVLAILARIRPPGFPARSFDVTAFGARGDGVTLNTDAFAKAIAACNADGGGRVVVPAGR